MAIKTLVKNYESVSLILLILVLLDTKMQMTVVDGQTYYTTSLYVSDVEAVVSSPNYPNLYPENQYRTWKFETIPGEKIVLVFGVFELEYHANCTFDFVELHDGNSVYTPLLGRFCGNKTSFPPIISSAHQMIMVFRSDKSNQFKGFTARYSTKCVLSVKSQQGIEYSPNYPNVYPHKVKCSWIYETTPGDRIKLAFNTLNMENDCLCDNVTLYDGESENDKLLGSFGGNHIPHDVFTTKNKMLMVFRSDHSINGKGFEATHSTVRVHSVNKIRGIVTSPEFPKPYPKDNVTIWEFETYPDHRLKIIFYSFKLQTDCSSDFVEFYNGKTSNDPLIGRFCGEDIPPPVTSTTHRMLMVFHSDHQYQHAGFEALYTAEFNIGLFLTAETERNVSEYFLNTRSYTHGINIWGADVAQTAMALFLYDAQFFAAGNKTGEEIAYELALQLMSKLVLKKKISTKELALISNAMTVTCMNPKNFFGVNVVTELSKRIDDNNETNPFFILALCNVGENVKEEVVHKLQQLYHAHLRPSWTEAQAISVMALECLSRQTHRDLNTTLTQMVSELKKKQQANGTVENLKNTALVVQALIATENYQSDFNMSMAFKSIQKALKHTNVGMEEMFYILPILKWKTLLDINSNHCANTIKTEISKKLHNDSDERIQVQVSIIIGNDMDFTRTWKIKVPLNYSFYQVLENISSSERDFKIQYIVTEGKLYVAGLGIFQDSVVRNSFWYIYTKSLTSSDDLILVEESPVDVKVNETCELVLWYRSGIWLNDKVPTNSTDAIS